MEVIFAVEDNGLGFPSRCFRTEAEAIAYAHEVTVTQAEIDVKRGWLLPEDAEPYFNNPEAYFEDVITITPMELY